MGEASPLSTKGEGASRFFPSRNVLCVSRSERDKNVLTESALALSVRAPLSPYLDDDRFMTCLLMLAFKVVYWRYLLPC